MGVLDRHAGLDAMEGFAASLFERLRRDSFDGVGITRESYAPGETMAHELIADTARQEGLQVGEDAAKNLIIALPGREPEKPFIACGSHLDSVPQGGNFDGAAGVVAGLTVVVDLKRTGLVPPRTVKVFAFRAEESAWFGKSWLGSNAMFGRLSDADLSLPRATNGQTLRDAMRTTGVDLDAVCGGKRLLDPAQLAAFHRDPHRTGPGDGCAGPAGRRRHRDLRQHPAHAHCLSWALGARRRRAARDAARCGIRRGASHRAA